MKFFRSALFVILGTASGVAAAADQALASFADVYRFTVSGAPLAAPVPAEPAQADAALRPISTEGVPARTAFTVAAPLQPAGGYAFSIGSVPEPQRWLLLLSGLAAAAWVARRRLYSL